MIPSIKSQSFREIRSSMNQKEHLKSILQKHPFIHCLEIITNKQPPTFPHFSDHYYQVLINPKFLKDENVLNDIIEGNIIFVSLTPIHNGNGLYIYKGNILFLINQSTYQRFGLQGQKYEDKYLISIQATERERIQRLQIVENIEGILYSNNLNIYEKYIEKLEISTPNIEGWKNISNFNFNIFEIFEKKNIKQEEIKEFISNLEESFYKEFITITSNLSKIIIKGFLNVSEIEEFLMSLGEESYCIISIWDMKDVVSSFLGKKLTMKGIGGGTEMILYGDEFPFSIEIQTVEYLQEE